MPRNYKRRKPETKPVTEEQIAAAKRLIEEGCSKRHAAERIGISEAALRKRLKLGCVAESMGRFKPTFGPAQELEFRDHCQKMDELFFGLGINDLRRLAYEFAESNKILHRFDRTTKMAGRDWVEGFLKRNSTLRLRQSAPTSIARAIGFNKIQVDRFYKNLAEINKKYNFRPNRIYNMDETGMSTVPKKTPKVVSVRGKKVVGKLVSAERGVTVTAICCMSATGHYIPPAFIYPRKKPKGELLEEGPVGAICMVSDSGYINTNLFLNWLYHFKDYAHPTKEDPILLVIDNHSSHINLEATNYARDHGIVILTLPPHSSHKIQPLDRSLFSPLKTKYAIECDKWMTQHPGRGITQFQVARLFNIAYKQVATMSNAESGFKVSGIFPFDDNLFDESDFAPSSVTDQIFNQPHVTPLSSTNEEIYGEASVDLAPSQSQGTNGELDVSPVSPSNERISGKPSMNLVSDPHEKKGDTPTGALITPQNEKVDATTPGSSITAHSINQPPSVSECTKQDSTNQSFPLSEITEQCSSVNNMNVSLSQLCPLPRISEKKRRSKASLKSEVITSSPFKKQLEEKAKVEAEKEARKKVKKPIFRSISPKPGPSQKSKLCAPKKRPLSPQPGPSKKTKLSSQKKAKNKNENKGIFCPLCNEQFVEPPIEEWIQCALCEDWWHEQCTAYECGIFVCDICQEKNC